MHSPVVFGERIIMTNAETNCLCCSTEIDVTEFPDPRDADICGYCLSDRMNEIRRRNLDFAPCLSHRAISREIAILAEIEIRLETAASHSDEKSVEIYERIIRMLRA
jgi:hypothetical protein